MFGRLLPRNLEELKLSFILNNNRQESLQWNWCRRSAARHYKMSVERRANCAAYPYHCSTVVITKLKIDIETNSGYYLTRVKFAVLLPAAKFC